MLAVYAIVNGNNLGWTSFATLSKLGGAIILHIIFIIIELNVKSPLVPLSLFKFRNITVSNLIGVLWAAGMFSWFFLSALYLQLVLHYTPLKVGLSFLPSNLIMAAFSLGLSAKIVLKFGIKKPLSIGLFLAASGLALLARAPIDGQYIYHVFPSMLLLGIGAGMAFNPMLLAAMSDAPEAEAEGTEEAQEREPEVVLQAEIGGEAAPPVMEEGRIDWG
jgi:hypothetical protein